MTDDPRTEVIDRAALAGRDHRWRRRMSVIAAWITVSVAALFVIAAMQYVHSQYLERQQSIAATAAQQLAAQIRGMGATPVVAAPAPIVGPAGAPGPAGQNGVSGGEGATGRQGVPGPSGAPGPTGPTGPTGAVGGPGGDGQPGAAGGAGPAGAAGPAGPQGDPGPTGPQGSAGSPPAGWSWTDPQSGASFQCARDAGSTDDSPTYTCSSTTTSPPSGGLLNLGGR